ncbi:MAG: spore coat protein CotH [Planctomycetes bacterium]|nr:spore coat protein CotH [Planctomycetota bacterium]
MALGLLLTVVVAQAPPGGESRGAGAGPGRGGPGMGPSAVERKLVKQFDKDKSGRLETAERKAARELMEKDGATGGRGQRGPGGRGPGGPGGRGPGGTPVVGRPGEKLDPLKVTHFPSQTLYDPTVLRTFFFEFEAADWEKELAAFYGTDVEVPAKLTVDGKEYPGVGVSFRGASSYFTVGEGLKKSLNVSVDHVNKEQRLAGSKTLNLLNAHGDPSYLSTALYSEIAREHLSAPKANMVEVVINGESWGVFVSAQQFNREFLQENYGTTEGARWKVKGSPGGQSGLDYAGEDLAVYKQRYQIRSEDKKEDWEALKKLCRTLSEIPLDKLEAELRPMFDVDAALWFLALDVVLINSDGYWIRASDYNLYRDPKGVFHLVPHDMNESFSPSGGMGPRGQRGQRPNDPQGQPPTDPQGGTARGAAAGGRGMTLDPFTGMDDVKKPLRSRLLRVPKLRAQYLRNVQTLASDALGAEKFGASVARYRALLEKRIAADTRTETSYESFLDMTAPASAAQVAPTTPTPSANEPPNSAPLGGRQRPSLNAFATQRREYLMAYKDAGADPLTPVPNRGR